MKILLIDDEQSLIDIFTQTFKTAGFEVVGAESGNEGILKAQTEHPDMIFLDQVLPDINGNQVLQMLKQDVETKDIPIAMLSNFNQDGMVRDAINLGAIDYILKYQIDPQDLIRKANQIIGAHTKVADKIDQSNMFGAASSVATPAPGVPAQSATPAAIPPVDPTPMPMPAAADPTIPIPPIAPMPEVPQANIPTMPPPQPEPAMPTIPDIPTPPTTTQPTPEIPSMETLTHNEPVIPESIITPTANIPQTPPVPQMPSVTMPDMPTELPTPNGIADMTAQMANVPMPEPVTAVQNSTDTLAQNGVVTPIPAAPQEPAQTPPLSQPTTQPTKIDS